MENIQHYRPLSYALHPATTSTTASSSSPGPVHLPPQPADDSSMVATTDAPSVASVAEGTPVSHDASSVTEPPAKRRPGRPKGSRVKKDSAKAVATPSLPEVNAQNQQYYEFQWRMLNLCAEFYGAAEELVKSTPPLVIAQCYQMGPGTPMDPLVMLTEAKRTCDTLLANPSELLTMPPPPMYPAMPAFYQPPPIVVANPAPYPLPMAPSYAHYPAAYYHPYPYAAPPPPPPPQASASAPAPGAWSDEEVERLRKLAEDSKTRNTTAEPDWDWVVGQWGHSRSREQILMKATGLNLRNSKRRRDTDDAASSASPALPASTPGDTASASPVPSAPTAVPPATAGSATAVLPWPMPTLAADMAPPASSYYRPRPAEPIQTQFVYQNGAPAKP